MANKYQINKELKNIQKECLKKRIGVVEAINQIDDKIGGITRIEFKKGTKFKIWDNFGENYTLNYNTGKKKDNNMIYAMAALGYTMAQDNGNYNPGGVHISREASTKHHTGGIENIISKYTQ